MRPTPSQAVAPGGFGSPNPCGPHHGASPDDFAGGQGHRRIVSFLKQGRDPDLDTSPCEDLLRVCTKLGAKVAEQTVGAFDQDDARKAWWSSGKSRPSTSFNSSASAPEYSTPVGPPPATMNVSHCRLSSTAVSRAASSRQLSTWLRRRSASGIVFIPMVNRDSSGFP